MADARQGKGAEVTFEAIVSALAPSPESTDAHIAVLKPLVRAVAETFGRGCEVVLHDLRTPDASIVAIAGNVTGRHVGGSMSQIGLSALAAGDRAEDMFNYVTRAPNGRVLKSTTVVLRDQQRRPFGLFCINYDVTDLRTLSSVLAELAGSDRQPPRPVAFSDDVSQVIAAMLGEEDVALGLPLDRLTKQDRLAILGALDRRGVFALQRSVPQVADRLGVSRATLYSDLQEIRAGKRRGPPGRRRVDGGSEGHST